MKWTAKGANQNDFEASMSYYPRRRQDIIRRNKPSSRILHISASRIRYLVYLCVVTINTSIYLAHRNTTHSLSPSRKRIGTGSECGGRRQVTLEYERHHKKNKSMQNRRAMAMLNPMRDQNKGIYLPGGRREDTCDHGFSDRLETRSDDKHAQRHKHTFRIFYSCSAVNYSLDALDVGGNNKTDSYDENKIRTDSMFHITHSASSGFPSSVTRRNSGSVESREASSSPRIRLRQR